jgi:hypothetical protein
LGLAALYVALTFILNPTEVIVQTTIGKLFTAALGPLFGKVTLPDTWKPSLHAELVGLINPGIITGYIVGFKDVSKPAQLLRSVIPGALLLVPLLLIVIVPQGIWLTLALGGFILATLPYALIGGTVGWIHQQKRSSALTNGLTGRRPG